MVKFDVPDMSCGHCTTTIEKAIIAIDPTAKVSCDLGLHSVEVDSSLSERVLFEAISGVGFNVKS